MLLKTILNRVQKYKGFIYKSISWNTTQTEPTIEVHVVARSNSRPRCSGCGRQRPGYDTRNPRRFEFIPSQWHSLKKLAHSLKKTDLCLHWLEQI